MVNARERRRSRPPRRAWPGRSARPPPPATDRATASAPHSPVSGSAMASAQNTGSPTAIGPAVASPPVAGPANQPARPPPRRPRRQPVPPSTVAVAAPVPGDAEPDLPVPVRDHLRRQPELSQRPRPGRLDHHVRRRQQRRQRAAARLRTGSQAPRCDARRAASRRTVAHPPGPPSGRDGVSTLMTSAPASPSSRAQSGPAHIDDRSTTTAPASRAPADGAAIRLTRPEGDHRPAPRPGPLSPGRQLGPIRRPPRRGRTDGSAPAGTPSSCAAPASTSARVPSAAASSAPHTPSAPAPPRPPPRPRPSSDRHATQPKRPDNRRNRRHIVFPAQVDRAPPVRRPHQPGRTTRRHPPPPPEPGQRRPPRHQLARIRPHLDPGRPRSRPPARPTNRRRAARRPRAGDATGAPVGRARQRHPPGRRPAEHRAPFQHGSIIQYRAERVSEYGAPCACFSGTGTSGSSSAPRASPTSATPPGACSSRSTSSSSPTTRSR